MLVSPVRSLDLSYAGVEFVGYGQTGPYAQRAGYDVMVEAEMGLMHITGPLSLPNPCPRNPISYFPPFQGHLMLRYIRRAQRSPRKSRSSHNRPLNRPLHLNIHPRRSSAQTHHRPGPTHRRLPLGCTSCLPS